MSQDGRNIRERTVNTPRRPLASCESSSVTICDMLPTTRLNGFLIAALADTFMSCFRNFTFCTRNRQSLPCTNIIESGMAVNNADGI